MCSASLQRSEPLARYEETEPGDAVSKNMGY